MIRFFTNRIHSFKFALKGIYLLVRTETNFKIQACAAVVVTVSGFIMHISPTEWMAQTIAIAMVLVAEGFNTAIEKLADMVHAEWHPKIGFIKDIAAGAVLITAMAAFIIGCLIYVPKFL